MLGFKCALSLPLSEAEASRREGGNRTVPLECAENFCCIYTWSLHAGQGHGELSHEGRTRQCEQSCGLGVGLGQHPGEGGEGATMDTSG